MESTHADEIREIWKLFRESERFLTERFAETDRQFKETDRQFKETDRQFKETDRQFKETDRQFKETDRQLKNLGKEIGGLGNALGRFTEALVRPGLMRIFRALGHDSQQVFRNVVGHEGEEYTEVDLLLFNEEVSVVVEVKTHLTDEKVDEHLARLDKFRRLFPRFVAKKVHGAVAAMELPDSVARYAESKGFYVLAPSGEDVILANSQGFVPRAW